MNINVNSTKIFTNMKKNISIFEKNYDFFIFVALGDEERLMIYNSNIIETYNFNNKFILRISL